MMIFTKEQQTLLVTLLLIWQHDTTTAFVSPIKTLPTTAIASRLTQQQLQTTALCALFPNHDDDFNYNNYDPDNNDIDNDTTNSETNWIDIAKEAGDVARKVGDKVLGAIDMGGNKLVDIVSQGAKTIQTAWQESHNTHQSSHDETQVLPDHEAMDAHDEDLFRGLFTTEQLRTWSSDEDGHPMPSPESSHDYTIWEGETFGGAVDDYREDEFYDEERTAAAVREVEAEVMEGVRRPTFASEKNKAVDAEILDKKQTFRM